MLIQLIDGAITDIHTDTSHYSGCSTCDYGSSYTNELTVYFLNSPKLYIEASAMFNYPLEMDFLMKLFITNLDHIKTLTEEECREFIRVKVNEHNKC